jgi:hypothetical protein
MRTMNLDKLVRRGQPPWHPVPDAEDVDVWEKYDFPIRGTYRLDGDLVIFNLITTAASRSLWAYVPAAPDVAKVIEDERQFETEAEFNDFLDSCFARHEAVFAAAENFVITTKSDGILIPPVRNALITVGTQWYLERSAALNAERQKELAAAGTRADSEELVRTAQGAISGLLD